MLPALTHRHTLDPIAVLYLDTIRERGFHGDIETCYASRLAVATDNSVYQLLPQAVVFPTSTQDLALLGKVSLDSRFITIRFAARGGGTGTNGQSLTQYLVVDVSRHMRKVLEINPDGAWVRVQAGVVKDALNEALHPYGFFFSPDLSTSNRATVGGMISTDASGQGSLRYGKTSDHVLSLKAVLADGSELDTETLSYDDINVLERNDYAGIALKTVANICRNKRVEIEDKFPQLNRFLTGYDLKNAYNPEQETFDIARVLCGAEGSLGFIAEAKLNITPIPKVRTLVNIKYNSFDSALRNATVLVEANALSIETIDSRVLHLARKDIVWNTVKYLLTDVPDKDMQGINLVEFAGDDAVAVSAQVESLCERLDTLLATEDQGVIGYQVCDDITYINCLYGMRKKAVGLLGATRGAARPVAFTEDTCVPPEKLADYIVEFRALLDSHNLDYGMFGHVDAGVLHVRPALDLCDPDQEHLMRKLSDSVVVLVAKYGGLMWGEHGKGFRSEYGRAFFGEVLFDELRKVKAAFDPENRMNPGKICTPFGSNDELVKVDGEKRGTFDRQIPIATRNSFSQVMECNGNGLCFDYDTSSPMCPSMKISYDRRHSPKGRSDIVREWLRLLSDLDFDPIALEKEIMGKGSSLFQIFPRFKNTWLAKKGEYDFSHEVMEAMNGCLACKACATQCPIKVDVPSFRSRFINLYYSRYQRPAKDYLVANIETLLPWMAKVPVLINAMTQSEWVKVVTKKMVGYVDTPSLSVPTLMESLCGHNATTFNLLWLQTFSELERERYVLIMQDPFTSFYESPLILDLISLIEKLGKKPLLLPFKPNGKAQHIKGFLKKFTNTALNTSKFLNQVADLGVPIIGVDPALVLCYRDEYNEILGDKRGNFQVLTAHEWLLGEIQHHPKKKSVDTDVWYLFSHCTEKTRLPNAEAEWGKIFKHFGGKLEVITVGCCGMAGTFGHESDKVENSKGIYGLSWKPRLKLLPHSRCMATGYSCRSQVNRIEQKDLRHPVQILLELV
ncbi:D-2-hydroxyglutarate dehydrogenase YdiJ [Candidatus Enterovibrio escicola]|uniref:D-2-hydroxyglutarate dehydrogenase n=1 Tax=Candidatus Enterovibrio escicola TaxID=1927127 RepID=A0A2A5T114_9GAMM|nr:FAD-binding and (Fe-S)-binding domain-containing protein [Candidatus Enterovibrio escacola]PCS21855.1 Glycolate dehydrogenase, subunit GlcD [Candidatus Enterovibrio escacola]